jgi:hypothetical protein
MASEDDNHFCMVTVDAPARYSQQRSPTHTLHSSLLIGVKPEHAPGR